MSHLLESYSTLVMNGTLEHLCNIMVWLDWWFLIISLRWTLGRFVRRIFLGIVLVNSCFLGATCAEDGVVFVGDIV